MTLPSPRAVLFDWDNTLVDTWPVIHRALNLTFSEFNLPEWSLEQTMARVRKSMRDSFPEIFGADWQEAGARYQQHYRASHLGALTPLPQAEELLRALRGRGLPLAVVSNKRGENLRQETKHLEWAEHFGAVIGADDAAHDKPHPAPLLMALSALKLAPGEDIWFVGDSEVDLDCAARAGCTAILYGPYAKSHPEYTPTHFMRHPYAAHCLGHGELMGLV